MKTIGLDELLRHPAWILGNVADLRSRAEYLAGHVSVAVSMPVQRPAGSRRLDEALCSCALPPRHEALVVLSDDPGTATLVAKFLSGRGRSDVTPCVATAAEIACLPQIHRATGARPSRLWKPPPFLAANADFLPPAADGPAVDFGSGSGRAAVWLAMRGYDVTAIDRYVEALDMGRDLARSCDVSCSWVSADLRQDAAVPAGPWNLALAFRFLERPLLKRLPQLLQPGGVAVVRTFRVTPDFQGPPSRRYCLEPGELLQVFPETLYEVLLHIEDEDDDGRPAAGIIAKLKGY